MSGTIQTAVLGAGGYVGGELLRLIAAHPRLELAAAVSDSRAGAPVADTFPHLGHAMRGIDYCGHGDWLDRIERGSKLALFCAAPHGASAATVASALEASAKKNLAVRVVDSSADFRYARQSEYEAVYESRHGAPELLDQFTCALPEHLAASSTPHVGHPGCFATATLLAAVPLIRSNLTDAEIFVSGITGSTGSGRSPQAGTHHPERNSNLYAYKPLAHRHAPEVASLAAQAAGRETRVRFVPHSGPFARGIHVTLQARATGSVTYPELFAVFRAAYAESPFVEVVEQAPKLKNVVASNLCHIGVATDGGSIVVMSVIDNLVKGAAGGAVQWMNRLWDLPETSGLTAPAPGWT